jgi:hypothetical protein
MRSFWMMVLAVAAWPFAATAQDHAMDAPASVHIRQAFDVDWTAPQDKGGRLEIRSTGETPRRIAYAYANADPQRIEAPEAPGDYTLVLIFDEEVRAARPLTVVPVTATLAAPSQTDAGAAVAVAWQGPNSRSDLITFAAPDGDPIRGTGYAYTGNSKDGTVSIKAPADAGRYDIVYVTGKTVIGRSPITVGGIDAALTVPPEVAAGAPLRVGFDGPENSGDYLSFAQRGGDPIRPGSYAYAGNSRDGTVTLRAGEEPGAYDVVYVSGGRVIGRAPVEVVPAAIDLAAPEEVQALQLFEATWRGQGNSGDWIVAAAPGAADGGPYGYVDPESDVVAIRAPEEPGTYELVYITRGGREMARRAIRVTPAPVDPGQIEVAFAPGSGFASGDAVEVILDASGSMLQRQGGERRIEIAKRTLDGLVRDTIPPGTGFALRVFGNREADACRTDLEIPLGPLEPAQAQAVIAGIDAVNLARTPIAASLALTANDLSGATGARVLILVTDGEETCEGDPAAAIDALRAGGTDIRVNIVGYAIDDADLARTFQSWAAAGGGAYFDAANAGELDAALRRATAAPFEIRNGAGALVGRGIAGDPPLDLPAGTYVVRIAGRDLPAVVAPNARTVVTP